VDREFPYWVRAYYGSEAKYPKVPGELAIETKHASESSRDATIEAANSRDDIGEVIWGIR